MSFGRQGWLAVIVLLSLGVASQARGDATMGSTTAKKGSWTDPISSFFKGIGDFFSPKPKPKTDFVDSRDPTALKNKATAGPDLRVMMAQAYEQQGNTAEAEKQYELALKETPKNTKLLCALARLRIRQGKFEEATKLYQQATKIAPDDPSVLNDVALCHARQNQWPEAMRAWNRCVQLQPKNALYRNNLAAAMVECGQVDGAMQQLLAVHNEAAAHYNLGYLLAKKGLQRNAAEQFQLALNKDPSLGQARQWLQRLGASPAEEPRLASRPRTEGSASWLPSSAMREPPQYEARAAGDPSESRPQPKILRAPDAQSRAGGPVEVRPQGFQDSSAQARGTDPIAVVPTPLLKSDAPQTARVRPLPPITAAEPAPTPGESSVIREPGPSGQSKSPVIVPLPPVQ